MKTWIVEDNATLRRHAETLLRDRIPSLTPLIAIATGSEALVRLERETADLLLLDIQLPGANGIEIARRAWKSRPSTRIVFWSQFKDEVYVRRISQLIPPETVYGFVLKTSPDEKLVQAVRAVACEEQCWLDREIRGVQARALQSPSALTEAEAEALIDVALGLTDRGIARRRYLSRRGAQNRLHSLYLRLGVERDEEPGSLYSPRNRAVFEGLRRGLINPDVLAEESAALDLWLAENSE